MTDNSTLNDLDYKRKGSDRINIIFAIAVAFICCLSIPLSSVDRLGNAIGIAAVIACSVFAVRVSARKILTVIAIVSLFTFFGLSGGLPIITILLACTVGCGAFSWLISKTESPFLALIPSVAYAAATVITKNWFASLLTLVFVFPAILMAQSYEKLCTRVSSLLRASLGFLAFIVLGVVFSILYFTGEFRTEIIGEVLDGVRDSLTRVMSSVEVVLVNGETQMLMSETDAYNYVSLMISLIPALAVILCNLFAYFAQKIQFSIFRYTEGEREFNELRNIFIMSPASATIFILSFLVYTVAVTSSSAATVATVSSNLYLMFMPGLALMGIKSFISGRNGAPRRGCSSVIIPSLFVFLLFFSTGVAIIMAACFGAFAAIEAPIRKHFSKKNKQ